MYVLLVTQNDNYQKQGTRYSLNFAFDLFFAKEMKSVSLYLCHFFHLGRNVILVQQVHTYNMPASWWLCPRQELHWALKKVIRIVHFCVAQYADGLLFFEKMSLVSLSSIFSWVAECSESRYNTYLSCNYLPSNYLSSCSSSTYF